MAAGAAPTLALSYRARRLLPSDPAMRASSKRKQGAIAAGGEGDGKTTTAASPGTPPSVAAFSPAAPVTPAGRASAGSDATASQHPPAPAQRKALQRARIATSPGFVAALDQSGGSTPRALGQYGIHDIRGDEDHMFALIHDMRTRIITSDAFTGDRIIGAILFEDTVFRRSVRGEPTASYLWNEKNIVPFLKIDRGLEPEKRGVRLMKPIPDLAETLARCGHFHPSVSTPLPAALAAFREHFRRDVDSAATDADADAWLERLAERTEPYLRLPDTLSDELDRGVVRSALVEHHRARDEAAIARDKASQGADIVSGVGSGAAATDASGVGDCVFGTKARSVVRAADPVGVREIVAQQFAIAAQVIAAGLVPIIEPEVDIHAPDKAAAETLVVDEISFYLDALPPGSAVCLKLTLPEDPRAYDNLTRHPRVMRVFALSGGYSREESARRLAACRGVAASFSRALVEGLDVRQSSEAFDDALARNVREIYEAALT